MASNGPGEQQVHRLEIAGMKKYFDYIFVSERIGASKPSKVFFERAFVELNAGRKEIILPEDTVMIGDSLTSDIAGGQAFGMEVCLFRRKEGMDIPDGVRWVDRLEQIEEIYWRCAGSRRPDAGRPERTAVGDWFRELETLRPGVS